MFELYVAMKHISARRRQTLLATGAVALAVAITIVEISAANGVEEVAINILSEIAPHVTVEPKDGEDYIHLYRTLTEVIWAMPGVTAVSPGLFTDATLSHEENVENVVLAGVIPEELNKISRIGDYYMVEGELAPIQNGRKVAVSRRTAEALDVNLGDDVRVYGGAEPQSLAVVGIFDTGVEWDTLAFVSLETAREFDGEGDAVNEIHIHLEDLYEAPTVAEEIDALGYRTESWQAAFPDILEMIEYEKRRADMIMLLITVIATFGIANVMNMLVIEKTGEIGIMMAMGATSSNIRRIFLLESAILGLTGALLGSLAGFLISSYLNSLKIFLPPVEGIKRPSLTVIFAITPEEILAVALVALLLSIAMGVYPANRASNLQPVEALKG